LEEKKPKNILLLFVSDLFSYPNGDIYLGDWKDDFFNGNGVYIFSIGERYEGELVNGYKSGRGTYVQIQRYSHWFNLIYLVNDH